MPYILGIDEIHVITDNSSEHVYKHVANDKFFVIYRDTPNTVEFIGKVIKDIIDSDVTPTTKAKSLSVLSHIPGVTLDAIYLDYIDRRHKELDTDESWCWTRSYDWSFYTYTEGKATSRENSHYVNSRFGVTFDVDRVLTDYMALHSASLWEYNDEYDPHNPTRESRIVTQRVVLQAQLNVGLLKGEIERYQLIFPKAENLFTAVDQEPHNYQKGFIF